MAEFEAELQPRTPRKFGDNTTNTPPKFEGLHADGITAEQDGQILIGCSAIANQSQEDMDICYTNAVNAVRRGESVNFTEDLKEPEANSEAKAIFEALEETGAVAVARMNSGIKHPPLTSDRIAVLIKGQPEAQIFLCIDGEVRGAGYPSMSTYAFVDWVKKNSEPKA